MAQPTPYTREFNFSNQQAETPSEPLPAPHVDAEFNRIKLTTDEILENLSLIQNDSGELIGNFTSLPDAIVTVPTLAADVLALISTGGTLPELEAVADYVIDEIATSDTADEGVDSLLSVKDGVIVKSHKPGFHPEDYLGVLTADAALAACRDAAIAAGSYVIISRPWTIKEPFNVLTNTHLAVCGGASLIAHPTLFTGDWLIEVGADGVLSDEDGIAEFWSITGEGKLDCGNDIDEAIHVIKGRFGDIDIKEIHGPNEHAIRVGTATNGYKSYEIGIRRTRAYYNNVANTATSKAFYFQQATDCRIIDTYSIGYRKGIRCDSTTFRIVMIMAHIWVRPVHGPLTHCIDNAGQWNTVDLCDFDTPTNNMGVDGVGALLGPDPSITTVYGCYNSNFNTIMGTNYLFMNAALKSDDLIIGIHETQDSYSRFGTLMVFTSNSNSYRFKKATSLFGGGTTSVVDVLHPGSSYFSGSPAGLSSVQSIVNQNVVHNGTVNFAVRSIHNAGLTASAAIRVTGTAGTNRELAFQTGGVDRIKLRANTAAEGGSNAGSDFYVDMYTDAGAYLLTAMELARATGDASFLRDITGGRNLTFKPQSSVTPGVNGQVTFEFTSNTQLTVKGKGSDGTVRSVVLTLA